jgi:antitoxin VapB
MQNSTLTSEGSADLHIAQVFFDGVNQTIRLPDDLRIKAKEVFIRKNGEDIILSPKTGTWDEYFATGHRLDNGFPEDIIDLPMDSRETF